MIGIEPMTYSLRAKRSLLKINNLRNTVVEIVGTSCYIKNNTK